MTVVIVLSAIGLIVGFSAIARVVALASVVVGGIAVGVVGYSFVADHSVLDYNVLGVVKLEIGDTAS